MRKRYEQRMYWRENENKKTKMTFNLYRKDKNVSQS